MRSPAVSDTTVKRFRARLGLSGSRAISNTHTLQEQEQIVLTRVDEDFGGRRGMGTIMAEVAFKDGVHIPRRVISDVIHRFYPDGFATRAPGGKQIRRVPKHPLGPHEHWSCDGHDKLNAIGVEVYSIVDDATGKRLGQWVVPNNREKVVIAYLYLTLVLEYGGVYLFDPVQTYYAHPHSRYPDPDGHGLWKRDNIDVWVPECSHVRLPH